MKTDDAKLCFDTNQNDFDLDLKPQRCKKAKTSAPIILQKFAIVLGEIWCGVETCQCGEALAHFILSTSYSTESILLGWFCLFFFKC